MNLTQSFLAYLALFFSSVFISNSLHAAPFQTTAAFGIGQSNHSSTIGRSPDTDRFEVSLDYFLRPVNSGTSPLRELPYTSKASFVGFEFRESKSGTNNELDALFLIGRFVTSSDYFFGFNHTNYDNSFTSSWQATNVSAGKYLDNFSTAIISIGRDSGDVADV